jgi:hypothetical protein
VARGVIPATLIGTRNFQDSEQFGSRELWV